MKYTSENVILKSKHPASKDIAVNVSADITKSYEAVTEMVGMNKFEAAQDSTGDPMFFFIGNDGHFYLAKRNVSGAIGWELENLSSQLIPADDKVVCFALDQNTQGEIYAVFSTGSLAFTSGLVPNNLSSTNWTEPSLWCKRSVLKNQQQQIKQLLVGGIGISASNALPLIICAYQNPNGTQDTNFINANTKDKSWDWKTFPLPENATKIDQMTVGCILGQQGIYNLYHTASGQTLEFTTLPDPHFRGKSAHYAFTLPPGDFTSIAALPPSAKANFDSSDLYISGEGVYLFNNSNTVSATEISAPTLFKRGCLPQSLKVAQNVEKILISCIHSNGEAAFIHGDRATKSNWSFPMTISSKINQLAIMREQTNHTNILFTVNSDNKLNQLWQDPATSHWLQSPIELPDLQIATEFNCYRTAITFEDRLSLSNQAISLNASQMCYLTVNGKSHFFDGKTAKVVSLDAQAGLLIENRVDGMSTPFFTVSGSVFEDLIVHPSDNIYKQLHTIKTANDLMQAKFADGTALLQKAYSDTTLNAVTSGLQHFLAVGAKLRAKQLPAAPNSIGLTETMGPSIAPLPNQWGMYVQASGEFVHHQNEAVDQHMSSMLSTNGLFSYILTDLGSLLRTIEHSLKKPTAFIVRQIGADFEYIVHVGGNVFKAVIKKFEDIAGVVYSFLKQVVVDLKEFVHWLGFVFDWADILKVHELCLALVNQGFDSAHTALQNTEKEIIKSCDEAKVWLKNIETRTASITNLPLPVHAAKTGNFSVENSFQHHSIQWILQKFLNANEPSTVTSGSKEIMKGIEEMIGALVKTAEDTCGFLSSELPGFLKIATAGKATISDLVPLLVKAEAYLINLINDGEGFVKGAFDIVLGIIDLIRQNLEAPLVVPVITWLYENVIAKGCKLSLLDGLMLLTAVPVTVFGKTSMGSEFMVIVSQSFPKHNASSANPAAGLALVNTANAAASGQSPISMQSIGISKLIKHSMGMINPLFSLATKPKICASIILCRDFLNMPGWLRHTMPGSGKKSSDITLVCYTGKFAIYIVLDLVRCGVAFGHVQGSSGMVAGGIDIEKAILGVMINSILYDQKTDVLKLHEKISFSCQIINSLGVLARGVASIQKESVAAETAKIFLGISANAISAGNDVRMLLYYASRTPNNLGIGSPAATFKQPSPLEAHSTALKESSEEPAVTQTNRK